MLAAAGPSAVEVRPRPQLEVQRPPELHAGVELASPVPGEPALGGARVDEAALGERAGGEDVAGERSEPVAEPAGFRSDKAELVAPVADGRRQEVAQRPAEESLRPAPCDEL